MQTVTDIHGQNLGFNRVGVVDLGVDAKHLVERDDTEQITGKGEFDADDDGIRLRVRTTISQAGTGTISRDATYLHRHDQSQSSRVLKQTLPWTSSFGQGVQSTLLKDGGLGLVDNLPIIDMEVLCLFVLVVLALMLFYGFHPGRQAIADFGALILIGMGQIDWRSPPRRHLVCPAI